MSVIRPKPPVDPIGVATPDMAPSADAAFAAVRDAAFDAARDAAFDAARDAAFDAARAACLAGPVVRRPADVLAAYHADRTASELFSLLATARRIREAADRLVVVASGPAHHAVRTLFATCCHPFHNALARPERGGRPKLFFAGHDFDNDSLAGLLDLVTPAGRDRSDDLIDRTGLVVVDDGDPSGSVEAAARLLRPAAPPEAVVEVAFPPELPAACGLFTAAAILPAAVVGIDVVRLLEGAVAMNTRFAEAPAGCNPVAFASGFERAAGIVARSDQTERLEPLVAWQRSVRSAVLPPSRAAAGEPAEVSIGEPRFDPLPDAAGMPWPSRAAANARPAMIRMPRLDEHAMGQLLQMLLVATVLEREAAVSPPSRPAP